MLVTDISSVEGRFFIYQPTQPRREIVKNDDVMAALGNDEAIPLLADELTKYQYLKVKTI